MINKFRNLWARAKRFEAAIFFTAGFLFDVLTLRRIDDWLKLWFQVAFLILIGLFLVLQYRSVKPQWQVPAVLRKIWPYQLEIAHFMFGSLLSAYAIFYFKSATISRSLIFMLLILILMFLNEFKAVRKKGVELKVVLFSFCVASFLIYFFPVLVGSMGDLVFGFSIVTSMIFCLLLVSILTKSDDLVERKKRFFNLSVGPFVLHLILWGGYAFKIIPPVPLSMSFGGIYHKVVKEEGKFQLYSLKPWYNFWSHGDKVFLARDQEPIFCFVRIFAPAQFSHQVFLRWQLKNRKGIYEDQDRIGMAINGGREDGYRGYAYKNHYQPGDWKLVVETEDARPIGEISFRVENDEAADERVWMLEEG